MKKLILISSLIVSSFTFASITGHGGGGGPKPTGETKVLLDFRGGDVNFDGGVGDTYIELDKNQVEALTTITGDYARMNDLEEGFVRFNGALIEEGKLYIKLDDSRSEINSVILNNGLETMMSRIIGGDMGGGGK